MEKTEVPELSATLEPDAAATSQEPLHRDQVMLDNVSTKSTPDIGGDELGE